MAMLIEEFLAVTTQRLPKVEEMIDLCDSLGITFVATNGKPYMRACPDCTEEAKVLANLFGREPFRTMVIERKLSSALDAKGEPITECLWPGTGLVSPNHCDKGEWPVGAFFFRKIGGTEWQAIPGRTWDADTRHGKIIGREPDNAKHAARSEEV